MGCGISRDRQLGAGFSDEQLQTLDTIDKAIPSLSLVGSLCIILCWLAFKDLRKFTFRLVVFMSIADAGAALSTMPDVGALQCGACLGQAWFASFFGTAEVLWTACISHCLLRVIRNHDMDVQRYERTYHWVCWGLSGFLAFLPLPVNAYGVDEGMCWIITDFAVLRFLQFYVPLWSVICYNIVTYYKVFSTLRAVLRTSNEAQAKEDMRMFWRLGMYPLILIFCWFFASVNRVQNTLQPDKPVFVLYVLQRVFSGFQGFLNAIAYGMTPAVRGKLAEVLCNQRRAQEDKDDIELTNAAAEEPGVSSGEAEDGNADGERQAGEEGRGEMPGPAPGRSREDGAVTVTV